MDRLRRSDRLTVPDAKHLLDRPTGLWRGALRRLLRRKTGVIGLSIIGTLVLIAVLAPLLAPYDPNQVLIGQDGVSRRSPPCVHLFGCEPEIRQHALGLDGNARDQFSRIIYGTRVSLSVGLTTVLFAFSIGATLGAIAGFWGGWTDNIIMRIMDVVLGFPSLLLAIAIVSALGPGLRNTMLAIAIVSIPAYARVMRASVLSIKELDFVSASRALGASKLRILWSRVVPNALTPLVVIGTLGIATAILDAAAFGFLGLGAQEPTAEWGAMLARERAQVFSSPHLVFFPGLAIMITVLGFNLLGDGLRDALDPSLSE
ncbi:MAG TPA: ABC transporter permease [Acidimicrobiia bacterium]|nr:ABC transporter permease [Acidimicrobiia bacterium]